MQWISVKDRLPKNDGEFLVCINNNCVTTAWFQYHFAEYYGSRCAWIDCDGDKVENITRWMPLPGENNEDA